MRLLSVTHNLYLVIFLIFPISVFAGWELKVEFCNDVGAGAVPDKEMDIAIRWREERLVLENDVRELFKIIEREIVQNQLADNCEQEVTICTFENESRQVLAQCFFSPDKMSDQLAGWEFSKDLIGYINENNTFSFGVTLRRYPYQEACHLDSTFFISNQSTRRC